MGVVDKLATVIKRKMGKRDDDEGRIGAVVAVESAVEESVYVVGEMALTRSPLRVTSATLRELSMSISSVEANDIVFDTPMMECVSIVIFFLVDIHSPELVINEVMNGENLRRMVSWIVLSLDVS